ncbi:hypothetical protein HDU79_010875 [Rhizoclosmatium sp. JEL0117]|nr:hypothetical protein HDU79_010875 [Rhizoclosmatium sp. JEL0117]
MKSFQISRMLFYDTGRQVDGMEALDGVCEIARDVIKSAVVDRLTHFFGMWKYRYDGVRRRWGAAVKHDTASVWKSIFSFWKARFDVYSGLASMAKTRREQRLFRAYWDKWIARKREKIELDFCIRHEAFVSKQIFSCKKNALQIWRLARLRKKQLNTIFDDVSSTTSQNLILQRSRLGINDALQSGTQCMPAI